MAGNRLAPEFGNVAIESNARKTRMDASSQGLQGYVLSSYGAAQDVADLRLGAATVPPRALSELFLKIIGESNNQPSH